MTNSRGGNSWQLDWLGLNRVLSRCDLQSWSTNTVVLSAASVVLICFIYFDLAVAPASLLVHQAKEVGLLFSRTQFEGLTPPEDQVLVVGQRIGTGPKLGDWEHLQSGSGVGSNASSEAGAGSEEEINLRGLESPKQENNLQGRQVPIAGYGDPFLPVLDDTILNGGRAEAAPPPPSASGSTPLPSLQIEKQEERNGPQGEAQTNSEEPPEPIPQGEAQTNNEEPPEQKSNAAHLPDAGCNIYSGRWIFDNASYPLYRLEDCPFADGGFRCGDNGRPDRQYENWRWQPFECDMPKVDPKQVLENLRGGRMVFVGDSLGRNQWESMLCLLSSAVPNKSRIYELNGNPITKHKGFLRFRFEDYDCNVEYYRSPFLVPHGRPPAHPPAGVKTTLKLDFLEWTSPKWENADILIFNSGHWWTGAKTTKLGVFFQVGKEVNTSMGIEEAFTRAMRTWSEWVKAKVDWNKSTVFFRGFASTHFRGGTWKDGGTCHKEVLPFPDDAVGLDETPVTNTIIQKELAHSDLKQVTFLDVTLSTNYRKDAHPAIWSTVPPKPINMQDCSHWCLPGVPDSWNEMIFAELEMRRWSHQRPHTADPEAAQDPTSSR